MPGRSNKLHAAPTLPAYLSITETAEYLGVTTPNGASNDRRTAG